jgi:hypothetical protein
MASEFGNFVRDDEIKTRTSRKSKNVLTVDRNTFYQDLLKFHETRG